MNNRRKVLLSIAGASTLATWKKPVVNAVSVPAHANTTCASGTNLIFEVTTTDGRDGEYAYTLWDPECNTSGEESGFSDSLNLTEPLDLMPGVIYEVCASLAVNSGGGSASGSISLECCDSPTTLATIDAGEGGSMNGICAVVVVNEEGTCSVSSFEGPPSCD